MARGTKATVTVNARRTIVEAGDDRQTIFIVRGVCDRLPRRPATNLRASVGDSGGGLVFTW
jgi:hypothetical protein